MIELWWWVEPLFYTVLTAMFIFAVISVLLEILIPLNIVSHILGVIIAVLAAIWVLGVAVWLAASTLIYIWG